MKDFTIVIMMGLRVVFSGNHQIRRLIRGINGILILQKTLNIMILIHFGQFRSFRDS